MRFALPHRIPAALLIALWVAAPILASLHGLEEQHVYCAEHSAFEETRAASPGQLASGEPQNLTVLATESQANDEHASCCFTSLGARDGVTVVHRLVFTPAPDVPAAPRFTPGLPPHASIAVFLIAPKNSPPFAA